MAAVLADQHRGPSGDSDSSFEDLLDNGIQRGLRVQGGPVGQLTLRKKPDVVFYLAGNQALAK